MEEMLRNRSFWVGLAAAVITGAITVSIGRRSQQYSNKAADRRTGKQEQRSTAPSRSIPVSALQTLVDSPVPNISSAALALANKRLGDGESYKALIASVHHDLDSSDPALSRKARLALAYLEDNVSMSYMPPSPLSIASTTAPDDEGASFEETLQALQQQMQFLPSTGRARRARPTQPDRERRRHRREAMLLHEGSGELSEDDIINLNAALAEIINAPHE